MHRKYQQTVNRWDAFDKYEMQGVSVKQANSGRNNEDNFILHYIIVMFS